jgi:hypothetical protein
MQNATYQKFMAEGRKNSMGIRFLQPDLHERLFNKILKGSKGGKHGEWSPKKSELLALAYEKAGGRYQD